MSIPIITAKNISVELGHNVILSDISFDIQQGEFIGIAGPNGAGKSTLIRTLLNLNPYTGSITLWDKPIQYFKNWNYIGYLPQSSTHYSLQFPATVEEIVSLGLISTLNWPRILSNNHIQQVQDTLASLKIDHLAKMSIHDLSGGQRQRVWLAKALVSHPKILILDEPTNALDLDVRGTFYRIITDLHQKGLTILLITHDMNDIGTYAEKLMIIDQKLVFWGNFNTFCESNQMSNYFGKNSQHLICHQHE